MRPNILSYCGHRHSKSKSQQWAIEIDQLNAAYVQDDRLALKDVSLKIPNGTCVALVGHNGAGKSTLLKVIAGLLPVVSGRVQIFSSPIGQQHHRIVYLPQRSEIDWHFPMRVEKLVMTGRYVHLGWFRRPSQNDQQLVCSVMQQLGVWDLRNRQIHQLSGGEQQRVLLARALAQDADLYLLDEPLNAIDVQTRAIVGRVLRDLRTAGKTIMVATHFIEKLSTEYDGALYLSEGKFVDPPPGGFEGISLTCSHE